MHFLSCRVCKLSLKAFPMCMRHLHESLKQRHHLRHYGRLQYMLFLKGIGLPLEESLRFWRGEFARGTTPPDKASHYNCYFIYFDFIYCFSSSFLTLQNASIIV